MRPNELASMISLLRARSSSTASCSSNSMSLNEKTQLPYPATSPSPSISQKQDEALSTPASSPSRWLRVLKWVVVAGILLHLSGCKPGWNGKVRAIISFCWRASEFSMDREEGSQKEVEADRELDLPSFLPPSKQAPRDRFNSVDWQPCLDHPDFLCGTLE